MIRSVSLLLYNADSSYLVHTLMMVGMCHLTFTSFSWSTDLVKIIGPHIDHGVFIKIYREIREIYLHYLLYVK